MGAAANDLRQHHNYIRRKPVGSIDLGRLAAANRPSLLPTPVTLPTSSSGNSLSSYTSHSSRSRNETKSGTGGISSRGGASTSSNISGLRRSNSAIVNQRNNAPNPLPNSPPNSPPKSPLKLPLKSSPKSPPTSSTSPTEKASFQFPASTGGFYETKNYRHINPNASAKSFSSRRPLSYIINNNNNNNDNNNSYKNYASSNISSSNTEDHGDNNRSQPSRRPTHGYSQSFSYGSTNSIAVGVPSFELFHNNGTSSESTTPRYSLDNSSGVDAGWRWKYHITPHRQGDMFMTTNPDAAHIERPVAPSYFVSVARTAPDGGRGFSLSFIDPVKRFCEVVVTRQFRGDRDFFEVLLYKKMESFDFGFGDISGSSTGSSSSVVGGGRGLSGEENARLARQVSVLTDGALLVSSERTELTWKGCAFLRTDEQKRQKRSPPLISSSGGSSNKIAREYVLQDDWRRTWVVGTKKPQVPKHQSQHYDFENEGDENDEFPNFNHLANKLLASRQPKSDVYFSLQGGTENGDRLISVLQRNESSSGESRSKKHSRSGSYDENARNGSNKSITPNDFGTLSVLEKVSQNIWPLPIALSVAVSYALHLDHGSSHPRLNSSYTVKNGSGRTPGCLGGSTHEGGNSVTEKFKRLGRKYKEGRLQVFYGNAL